MPLSSALGGNEPRRGRSVPFQTARDLQDIQSGERDPELQSQLEALGMHVEEPFRIPQNPVHGRLLNRPLK
ncbi:MAG: hypothetical protein V1885_00015 [Candidatus Brennerbacteria bacterium]